MPGGPNIEHLASQGDASRFELPRPMIKKPGCMMSFSGLKTAVIQAWEHCGKAASEAPHLAASLQQAVADCLINRSRNAMRQFRTDFEIETPDMVVSGGVAANQSIRHGLEALANDEGFHFHAPPIALCTDNAVMIAWAAAEYMNAGLAASPRDFAPRPRWPLAEMSPSLWSAAS